MSINKRVNEIRREMVERAPFVEVVRVGDNAYVVGKKNGEMVGSTYVCSWDAYKNRNCGGVNPGLF